MKKEDTNILPEKTGVYIFKNKEEVLYVGKATNIRKRVKSYFVVKERKAMELVKRAENVDYITTDSVIEALIKEAELIKKHRPSYNIKENDDRSFLYLVTTKEEYPRVLLKRGREIELMIGKKEIRNVFGPFVYASEIRSALKIVRKIFPYSTHAKAEIKKGKLCFYSQIGLCPGVCGGNIEKNKYLDNIKNIEYFFKGKKKKIIKELEKEMRKASKDERYEDADELKRKINALNFIVDTVISQKKESIYTTEEIRIEGYDISNISGKFAVGAMVVFQNNIPDKKEYRLFKIKREETPDDVGMMKEVIERRLNNNWKLPDIMLIDGGLGQVNAVKRVLLRRKIRSKVIGIAKGKDRKKEEVIGVIPKTTSKEVLLNVQGEAHRFAINYHRKLRSII